MITSGFDLESDADSDVIAIGTAKIGAHYQHLTKPAWEFPEGRVIVVNVAAMGVGPGM